ncbi:cytochrome P450 [Dactylonectria estremocensis]|uniref:Cytochrome P450 n=1 Tax=Dactylonectria estremocensis TaxID=1079267 RepID=A0A9P9J111_9HYPO|nr:cytochrome P450 [Dactylonectria estremocensis]
MAPNIFRHIDKFLAKLDEFERAGKPLEVSKWTRYLTFEVVSESPTCAADVGFGGDYDMISSGELNHPFVGDFDGSVTWGILKSVLPWVDKIPSWIMGKKLADWSTAGDRTLKHAQDGLTQWRHHKKIGKASSRVDILQRLIEHGEKKPNEKLSEQELETEIMEIMLAGGDTTATTVTYGLYELAKNSLVQEKLRAALCAEIVNPADVTLERLEAVPYLDWTVKEMLRTHPTLPSLLERVVPAEGAQIAGFHVPVGSIIGMSAWSMNMSPDVFPDPLVFQPESLAITQTRIHIGTILRNFTIELHPETTPDVMRTVDNFQGKPAEDKVLLFFKRAP